VSRPVVRPRAALASQHLGEKLSPYADRSLAAAALLACDQHVSICPGCRAAADAERRLLRSLRSAATPGLSSQLECALLDLAGRASPQVPAIGPAPLEVIGRSAPAMYRSPVRAAMLAGLVAGASAAAAWSLSLNGLGAPGATFPVARAPSSATTTGLTTTAAWSSQATSFLSTNQSAPVEGPWPTVPIPSRRSAQSTHE
jgi:anti-sigma factor RsiW